jgi:hypothetical protein
MGPDFHISHLIQNGFNQVTDVMCVFSLSSNYIWCEVLSYRADVLLSSCHDIGVHAYPLCLDITCTPLAIPFPPLCFLYACCAPCSRKSSEPRLVDVGIWEHSNCHHQCGKCAKTNRQMIVLAL